MSEKEAFLAMPYRPEFKWVRNAIASACRQLAVDLHVADERTPPGGDIMTAVRQQILRCSFAYAVLVDLNPNVMYELGLLHQASKPTILLSDRSSPAEVPFDIRHLLHITFDSKSRDEFALTETVVAASGRLLTLLHKDMRTSIATGGQVDSISAFGNIQISITQFDFEEIKKRASKAVGRTGCATTNISAVDSPDFKGWKLRAKCSGGEKMTVLVDLNGEVSSVDVE